MGLHSNDSFPIVSGSIVELLWWLLHGSMLFVWMFSFHRFVDPFAVVVVVDVVPRYDWIFCSFEQTFALVILHHHDCPILEFLSGAKTSIDHVSTMVFSECHCWDSTLIDDADRLDHIVVWTQTTYQYSQIRHSCLNQTF